MSVQPSISNKRRTTISQVSACAALLLTSSIITVNAQAPGIVMPANAVEFEQVAPFVKMGAAWGNRAKGKHGTFGEFPGNATSPPHVHSGDYHAIVISGVMTNPFKGETNPEEMGPGSYWYVPAGVEHITACVSAEPCRFYFHADAAFDFAPAGE